MNCTTRQPLAPLEVQWGSMTSLILIKATKNIQTTTTIILFKVLAQGQQI